MLAGRRLYAHQAEGRPYLADTLGEVAMYGELVGVEVWREGVARHATLMAHGGGSTDVPFGRNGLLPFSYFGLLFYPSSLLVSPPRAGDRRYSGSERGRSEPCSSSSGVMTRIDIKAFLALEVMKSCYGFDSTLTVESLVMIQKHYSIPDEYGLHASSGNAHMMRTPGGSASLLMPWMPD
ncbi:hypothetical protein B296_00043036 [Ensete ventricosum]|uniref:Uncharacterized protein n=1 Tax=Ensete ventricosum TaxID=4639 RepID=A0A426XMH8_ENSVE|nr:hypothetical protein B296_00043036 [Ensete ventricosum]